MHIKNLYSNKSATKRSNYLGLFFRKRDVVISAKCLYPIIKLKSCIYMYVKNNTLKNVKKYNFFSFSKVKGYHSS